MVRLGSAAARLRHQVLDAASHGPLAEIIGLRATPSSDGHRGSSGALGCSIEALDRLSVGVFAGGPASLGLTIMPCSCSPPDFPCYCTAETGAVDAAVSACQLYSTSGAALYC